MFYIQAGELSCISKSGWNSHVSCFCCSKDRIRLVCNFISFSLSFRTNFELVLTVCFDFDTLSCWVWLLFVWCFCLALYSFALIDLLETPPNHLRETGPAHLLSTPTLCNRPGQFSLCNWCVSIIVSVLQYSRAFASANSLLCLLPSTR